MKRFPPPRCTPWRFRLLCAALIVGSLPGVTFGAASGAAEREKARLQLLREQRVALERQLKATESYHAATTDQLRDTEKAISTVGRKLHALGEERAAARVELGERERELNRLERQVVARQSQLAQLLRHQFRPLDTDAMASLLSGRDPAALARDRHFLALLSQAKAELLADLRQDVGETRRLTGEVQQRGERLSELAKREEDERASLQRRQQERQAVLAKMAGQIKAQRREIETLKQDEQRLGNLVASLAKRQAKAEPQPKKPVPAAKGAIPSRTLPAEPVDAEGAFARLRGKLTMPARGTLAGRFGARREDGQSVWKGLFIRAAEGSDVKAVAGGVVVFADWLRGYGNLVIVDHGDDFLSIYGNNQSLLADVGQKVGAGGTVATVGAGAGAGGGGGVGLAESGLYFELRHRGRAFDPSRWLKAQ